MKSEQKLCSGRDGYCQYAQSPVGDDQGGLLEILAVGRDVTDHKKAEALPEADFRRKQALIERIERLRRLTIEKTLVEDAGRRAIARDLQEGPGQLLQLLESKLAALLDSLPAASAKLVWELEFLLADARRQVRSISRQLNPPVVNKPDLYQLLCRLAEEMEAQYGFQVELDCDSLSLCLLPDQVRLFFHSARELLIHVARYSGSTQARLKLAQTAEQVILWVEDVGGCLANAPATSGHPWEGGLASIRDNLASLGGKVELVITPGTGLRIALRMSLKHAAAQLPWQVS